MVRIDGRVNGRIWRRWALFALAFCFYPMSNVDMVKAHNNPGFKEVLLITIDVADQPLAGHPTGAHSEPFSLDLPKKTIELIWRIDDAEIAGKGVTFAVAQGDAVHADSLEDGSNSRILRGDDIRIIKVAGAAAPFRIQIFANVIDRSKPADS